MPGRDLSLAGKVELAQPPPFAPFAQKTSYRLSLNRSHHDSTIAHAHIALHYLRGN